MAVGNSLVRQSLQGMMRPTRPSPASKGQGHAYRKQLGIAAAWAVTASSLICAAVAAQEAAPPRLSLPIACELGKDCFVQSYVDIAAGQGVRDYACGDATYDGHTGIDIRLQSAAAAKAGVPVLAVAEGFVKGMRDGETDVFVSEGGREPINGRECGNGVVIDHGGGWETQVCHMRQGSVRVKVGQTVKRGDQLGDVGFSGLADFAHVHLSVRHAGKTVDPFTEHELDGACLRNAETVRGMWTEEAAEALAYRTSEILGAEIADRIPSTAELEHDHHRLVPASPDSDTLLLVARLIKVRQGDVVRLLLTGPGGLRIEGGQTPLPKSKATYVGYAGRKRPAELEKWPTGRYEGRITVERNGEVLAERRLYRDY